MTMEAREYRWPLRIVSSAVGTQAELGSVALERYHSHGHKI